MPVCEGCGIRTDEAHVASRAQRIELAARYRPLQIKVLFLDSAPPPRIEDFFYNAAQNRNTRSVASRSYFDELGKTLGPALMPTNEDGTLAEFRRRGFFLTHAVECPFENEGELHAALRRLAPTALNQRIDSPFRPDWLGGPSGARQRRAFRGPLPERSQEAGAIWHGVWRSHQQGAGRPAVKSSRREELRESRRRFISWRRSICRPSRLSSRNSHFPAGEYFAAGRLERPPGPRISPA
jgi:hypothetical protein